MLSTVRFSSIAGTICLRKTEPARNRSEQCHEALFHWILMAIKCKKNRKLWEVLRANREKEKKERVSVKLERERDKSRERENGRES